MSQEHTPLYRPEEACAYLKRRHGIDRKPGTFAKYRCIGGGPKFKLVGRFPVYPEQELDAWAESITGPLKVSTSDKAA